MKTPFLKSTTYCILASLLAACGGGESSSPSGAGGAASVNRFTDVTPSSGLDYIAAYQDESSLNDIQKFCSGVAAGDINNDGLVDLFIVRGDIDHHLLYLNRGGHVFEEVSQQSGISSDRHQGCGATFADIDGDEDLDLFVSGIQGQNNLLYENTFSDSGEVGFREVGEQWGISSLVAGQSISASFGDYDSDGWLDLFIAHWGTPARTTKQHLFRNVDGTHFQNVTLETGLADALIRTPTNTAMLGPDHDYSFLASFADVNNDSYQDLLVVGDFGTSQVFLNTGAGQFISAPNQILTDENGMGSAVADFDNDGDLDWFVSGIFNPSSPGNRFYRNDTIGDIQNTSTFTDITSDIGVADGAWGWAACAADFNADGIQDIFHVTGWDAALFGLDYRSTPSRLFLSEFRSGSDGFRYSEQSRSSGLFDRSQFSSVVCFDADQDGDIDILTIGRSDAPATLYQNNGIDIGNYLSVQLLGKSPNTQAAGARIYVQTSEHRQMREIQVGSNFTSQNPTEQFFGIGSAERIEEIRIAWPDARITVLADVMPNQKLVVSHPDK